MTDTMTAYSLYGKEDLRAEAKPKPVAGPGQVIVKIQRIGICGSDMHYYEHGYCGAFVPKRPFILGHEFSGQIIEIGEGVKGFKMHDRVAVDPSHPCHVCEFCLTGRYNLCENMRFLGSASVDPHIDGAYCEYICMPAENCFHLPASLDYGKAALLEPLSVCIHAARQAGELFGKTVLITGAGTIGQLLLQVLQTMGAAKVCVSDVKSTARDFSLLQGAQEALDPLSDQFENQAAQIAPKGFDVIFEVSGAPAALKQAIHLAKRGATLVQVGTLPQEVSLPANLIMVKELKMVGSFRFANVIPAAIDLVASGRGQFDSIITHTFKFDQLLDGMKKACSREDVVKVHISLDD